MCVIFFNPPPTFDYRRSLVVPLKLDVTFCLAYATLHYFVCYRHHTSPFTPIRYYACVERTFEFYLPGLYCTWIVERTRLWMTQYGHHTFMPLILTVKCPTPPSTTTPHATHCPDRYHLPPRPLCHARTLPTCPPVLHILYFMAVPPYHACRTFLIV